MCWVSMLRVVELQRLAQREFEDLRGRWLTGCDLTECCFRRGRRLLQSGLERRPVEMSNDSRTLAATLSPVGSGRAEGAQSRFGGCLRPLRFVERKEHDPTCSVREALEHKDRVRRSGVWWISVSAILAL